MYKNQNPAQQTLPNFYAPFSGGLTATNRWILLAELIPWDNICTEYAKNFDDSDGAPALNGRIAFGALFLKAKLGVTDRELVDMICESPYLQYFIGLTEFHNEAPFHHSMMTHFRKRISPELIDEVNECIVLAQLAKDHQDYENHDDNDNGSSATESDESVKHISNELTNEDAPRGDMIVDATCAPADITYPTDLKLLNEAREKTEMMIDRLHLPLRGLEEKPRTYREKARKVYLAITKKRNPGAKRTRKAVRKQLGYVKRNLEAIRNYENRGFLHLLGKQQLRDLRTIRTLYKQQQEMYDTRSHRCPDRIVSISQPHVRPIVRGKAGVPVEFGAKLSASIAYGFVFVDRVSFDPYNEAGDLITQAKSYKQRHGYYPARIHCDAIYRTSKNRKFCKEHGIRMSGMPKPANDDNQDANEETLRVAIEGKFGQGKRRFSLSRVMAKLKQTSLTVISMTFLVMNLEKILSQILSLYDFMVSFITVSKQCIPYTTQKPVYRDAFYKLEYFIETEDQDVSWQVSLAA